jgi:hypothetical protein
MYKDERLTKRQAHWFVLVCQRANASVNQKANTLVCIGLPKGKHIDLPKGKHIDLPKGKHIGLPKSKRISLY